MVWRFTVDQLLRCRNLALNSMFSYIKGWHGDCQLWACACPHTPECPLYICTPSIHLYAPCTPVCPHTPCTSVCSPYTICSPYVIGTCGASVHPICLGVFWGLSVHLSGILVSVSTSTASQFITVRPVAPHHCGLLLYWTGCLWMSAMLHAVCPFFVD